MDERGFRAYYRDRNLPVARLGLGFGVLLVAAIITVDYLSTDPAYAARVVPLRIVLMLLPLVVAFTLSFVPAWRTRLEATVTLAAFLCGVGIFSNSFVAAAMHNTVVLWGNIFFTFYVYLVLGISFRQSVVAASPLFVIALGFGIAYDAPVHKLSYVFFSQVIGMITSYRLEQDAREIYASMLRLESASRTDGLTKIFNRGMFDAFLPRAWRQAARERSSIGLLLVDVDHFKAYNDALGHQAGDDCLVRVAGALDASVKRPLDFVARYGGEEFVVVLYAPDAAYLETFADRLGNAIRALEIPHPASPSGDRITVSVGAGLFDPDGASTPADAIALVDEALYAAKTGGRNRAVVVGRTRAPVLELAASG